MAEARYTEHKHNITQEYSSGHQAIDIGSNKDNTKNNITSHSDGKVKKIYNGCNKTYSSGNSYGNYIEIDYGCGYTSLSAHIEKDSFKVKKGDMVKQGQVVAKMGNTGHSTGKHDHQELKHNGKKIDPTPYLYADLPIPKVACNSYELTKAKYIRTQPKVANNTIKQLPKGAIINCLSNQIFKDDKLNCWVYCQISNLVGYVCIYDTTGSQAKEYKPVETKNKYQLLYDKWLRKSPKVATNKIKKLKKGTIITSVDNKIYYDTKKNEWVKTSTGYICVEDSTGTQCKKV